MFLRAAAFLVLLEGGGGVCTKRRDRVSPACARGTCLCVEMKKGGGGCARVVRLCCGVLKKNVFLKSCVCMFLVG